MHEIFENKMLSHFCQLVTDGLLMKSALEDSLRNYKVEMQKLAILKGRNQNLFSKTKNCIFKIEIRIGW